MTMSLASFFSDSEATTYLAINSILSGLFSSVQGSLNGVLTAIQSTILDSTLNMAAKFADCEKAAVTSLTNIWKQVTTDVGVCMKAYAKDDAYYVGNASALFKMICAVAIMPLNNITMCISSNALKDAQSINEANNCTIGALVTCIDNVWLLFNRRTQ